VEVSVLDNKIRATANTADLIADYKYHGIGKQVAWGKFVTDRLLRPEMNAKEFYALYEATAPARFECFSEMAITPTHHDNVLGIDCQITKRDDGVFMIVWADGHTGSNPPIYPPDPERYVKL
jgi:hypothetical protein